MKKKLFPIALVILALGLFGCASGRGKQAAPPASEAAAPAPEAAPAGSPDANDDLSSNDLSFLDEDNGQKKPAPSVRDPFSPFNRAMYHFNDKFYFWLLKPVTRGYKAVTPQPLRKGARNFFINLGFPARFLSCLLQGRPHDAEAQLARFFYNSTVGVLGFTDIAEKKPELAGNEDIGQALGKWGVDPGPYIVLPILGPFTLRDLVGFGGDRLGNPETYVKPFSASLAIAGYQVVNDTSFTLGDYETLKAMALDPYEAMRDAYVQSREKKISE